MLKDRGYAALHYKAISRPAYTTNWDCLKCQTNVVSEIQTHTHTQAHLNSQSVSLSPHTSTHTHPHGALSILLSFPLTDLWPYVAHPLRQSRLLWSRRQGSPCTGMLPSQRLRSEQPWPDDRSWHLGGHTLGQGTLRQRKLWGNRFQTLPIVTSKAEAKASFELRSSGSS